MLLLPRTLSGLTVSTGALHRGAAPMGRPAALCSYTAHRAAASRVSMSTTLEPAAAAAAASDAAAADDASLGRSKVSKLLARGKASVGSTVMLKGWVRTVRDLKNFSFVELNDGSSLQGLQVVAQSSIDTYGVIADLSTGAACTVVGEVVASQGAGQEIEVQATVLELVGGCPADTYPLQKKRHSLEFLRSIAHLRPRSNLFGAVSRVRSALAQGTHLFFSSEDFQYVQTPLLTASDCEGAGEMFRVTTLDPAAPPAAAAAAPPPAMSAEAVAELEGQIAAQGDAVRAVKEQKKAGAADKAAVDAVVAELLALKAQLPGADGAAAAPAAPPAADAYAEDFFGRAAYLTVSGQLSAETYACALGDVYTFGPTFRAEQSNTARHLAEFWMIEPEMAFCDLEGDMANAEVARRPARRRRTRQPWAHATASRAARRRLTSPGPARLRHATA